MKSLKAFVKELLTERPDVAPTLADLIARDIQPGAARESARAGLAEWSRERQPAA